MVDKRRFIEQLPSRLRTEDLQKFFSATVDHVFQPGNVEPISGYIGQYPSYYDPEKDFYIPEPTAERGIRQLEPIMATVSNLSLTRILFYDDLVRQIAAQGGITSSEDRLFENDFYSWAPPVDLGKLNSPHNYYWFGDDPTLIPGLLLSAPVRITIGNNIDFTFTLPPTIAGLTTAEEAPAVWVDGAQATITSSTSTTVTIDYTPAVGAVVEVYRYGDLQTIMVGKPSFDASPFTAPSAVYVADGTTVSYHLPEEYYLYPSTAADVAVYIDGVELGSTGWTLSGDEVVFAIAPSANSVIRLIRNSDLAPNVTFVVNGMRVVFNDSVKRGIGFDTTASDVLPWDDLPDNTFIIDGVGTAIEFFDFSRIAHPDPLYTVMDRRCRNQNPWATSNLWVHRDAFAWSHVLFSDRVAKRPIIEFQRDLELYHYGRRNIGTVDCVITGQGYVLVGGQSTQLSSAAQINGMTPGTVFDDFGQPLEIGQRLLICSTVPGRSDLSATVVDITAGVDGNGNTVMTLSPETNIQVGDIVTVGTGFEGYYHAGDEWLPSQSIRQNPVPLFALYDKDQTSLSDTGFYTGFAGSTIFSYAVSSSSSPDAVLGIPLTYDAYGQIVFENVLWTQVVTSASGSTYAGMKFYCVLGLTAADDAFGTDWHPVASSSLIYGGEVPSNLQANPDNEQVTFISKNQWLDHFRSIIENQVGFDGDPLGLSNWDSTARDVAAEGVGPLRIVQHKSPLLKTMLIASDTQFDYMDAARYVEQEYARFRSRFVHRLIQAYTDGQVKETDTNDTVVATVLRLLKQNKTSEFPFAFNTIGDPTNKQTYFIPPTPAALGMTPCVTPAIEVDNSSGSPVQQLCGHDGSRMPLYFDTNYFVGDGTTTQFVLNSDAFGTPTVTVNGTPVTATVSGKLITLSSAPKLGATIAITVDDIRDRAMLALETAIYSSLPSRFRTQTTLPFELITWLDGAFRNTGTLGYRHDEFARILTPMFLRWVQTNGLDYRTNDGYVQGDPFTWNFSQSYDRYGNRVPGHWRGIYLWYFDTDRPHVAPWEMLGFAEKPTWWETEYGAAPYTSGNTKLWQDLRDGRIAQGPRAGVDARYARPDLLSVLPVDSSGDLLNPMAAQIIPTQPTYLQANRPWAIGDVGPVEHLWRLSPAFPFALAQAGYLMKPARFVEQNWDTLNNGTADGQWMNLSVGARVRNSTLSVHAEQDSKGVQQTQYGLQQWIAEAMIARGQQPTEFGDAVRALQVRLGHKMAGFVMSDNLRVMADNFGLIPQEDVSVFLYTSPSYEQQAYSGVLVEWSGTGWRVYGYDSLNPSFTIELGDPASQKIVVSITDAPEPIILPWKSNVYYRTGILVDYKGSVYECNRAHTSASIFEQTYWTARPDARVPEAPRVFRYSNGTGDLVSIPYGTEFQTYQELADFIFGYERYLLGSGWTFDNVNESGPVDWTAAMREFLSWASMQWAPGYFIALSPGAIGLKFVTDHGMVYSLEQAFNGSYGLVNRDGFPIKKRDTFVSRIDGEVTVKAKDDNLYGARINVGEVEHALVFSNQTIFNDIIYQPLFDLRQPRLRLNGYRTTDWTGRFDAPGYVITNGGMLANFDRAAEDIRTAFDIEGAGSTTLRSYARHIVGFENRSYMSDLLISDIQQFEFYQGMIQQKGSVGAFDKLLRSQFIEQNRNLQFLEEWAFKLGSYGAIAATKRVAFDLWQNHIQRNPQLLKFSTQEMTDTTECHFVTPSAFISGGEDLNVFPLRDTYRSQKGDLPNAGYVRLNEVQYTSFNRDFLPSLYALAAASSGHAFADGERIWVYDGANHDWEVLRSTNLSTTLEDNPVVKVVPGSTTYFGARVYLQKPHGLTDADRGLLIVIDGETRTKADLMGVQTVYSAADNWIELQVNIETPYRWTIVDGDTDVMATADDPINAPLVRALRSVRFSTIDDLNAATSSWLAQAANGELAYVDIDPDGDNTDPNWVVRACAFRDPASVPVFAIRDWNTIARVQPKKVDSQSIAGSLVYDTKTKITTTQLISEPLILDHLTVIDPVGGLIAGEAERELSYKLEYDPARYNRGSYADVAGWADEHVGQLWWNLSTVRFLNAETDEIDGGKRGEVEARYRADHWGKLAPGSSIDIYEWTRNLVPPRLYDGEGVVYNAENPSWVEAEAFDPGLGRLVTVYYYWVRNRSQVDSLAQGRRLDSASVARIIENSSSLDLPWIAPTSPNSLLVGGVMQFLSGSTTVLQIDVQVLKTEAPVHTEWKLLRSGDPLSQPPQPLWAKFIDSLAGVDRFKRNVPDQTLNQSASQGIWVRPRQSLFGGTADARNTLMLARESMVGILNRIFAREDVVRQRVLPVQRLLSLTDHFPTRNETDITPAQFAWSAQDEFECALPSVFEYDFEVYSREERDALLLTNDFALARSTGRKWRVLINGLEAEVPFWSVWVYNPASDTYGTDDAARYANADSLFTLAPAYDIKVTDRDARNATTPIEGEFVYVVSDSEANGFWTLWRYLPQHYGSDANGYLLLRAQDYSLSDFIDIVDWYAEGYSASNPPVVAFADKIARDNALGDQPGVTFVRVDDDGSEQHGWIWTAFANDQWTTVALEAGTIRIKDDLFNRLALDESITTYGTGPQDMSVLEWDTTPWDVATWEGDALTRHTLANIPTRDGALDVRAMLKALIEEVLTPAECNEFFFSLVHFAHAHLDQVNWAFKTSFLYIGGYNEELIQSPVQIADNTQNLLDYIDEVKPYRVKIRDFAQTLAPPIEVCNTEVTDFDKPVWFDATQGRFRRLDPNVPTDVAILSTGIWKRWYENYQKAGVDLSTYSPDTWNPIRRTTTTIMFDRVDGWVRPTETAPFFPYFAHNGDVTGGSGSFIITSATPFEASVIEGLRVTGTGIGDKAVVLKIITPTQIMLSVANNGPVSGTILFLDNHAAQRIEDFYVAKFPGQRAKNLDTLLKLDFKGIIDDGGLEDGSTPLPYDVEIDGDSPNNGIEVDINPTINGLPGLPLIDPSTAANRPEELVFLGQQDYIAFTVHSQGQPGAPSQFNKFFDVSGISTPTTTLSYLELPQSNDGLAVFRDGIRAEPADYSLDVLKREIDINLVHPDSSRVRQVSLHIFGVGGTSNLLEQRFWNFEVGDAQTAFYVSPQTDPVFLEAFINGHLVSATVNWATGQITFGQTLNSGDDINVNVRSSPGAAIDVYVDDLPYNASGFWQIPNWNGTRPDAHAQIVLELDGLRLIPPETRYLRVGSGFRWTLIDHQPASGSEYDNTDWDDYEWDISNADVTMWNIFVDGVEYLGTVPDVTGVYASPADVVSAGASIPESFVYWNDGSGHGYIICPDDTITTDDVVLVINEGNDFTVGIDGGLLVNNPPADTGSPRLRVTHFSDVNDVGIETWTYLGRPDGKYPIYHPYAGEYLWVTVNGKKVVNDVHFNLSNDTTGSYFASTVGNWDLYPWDTDQEEYDAEPATEPVVRFMQGHQPTDEIIITVFKNAPMRLPNTFLAATIAPGKSLMQPVSGSYDDSGWDTGEWDEFAPVVINGANVYHMEGGWEYVRVRDGHTGYLASPITMASRSLDLVLPDYSRDIFTDPWFLSGHGDAPGVVWIDGERVEYSTITQNGDTVTLGGLVRSSKGTRLADHQAGTAVVAVVRTFEPRNNAL